MFTQVLRLAALLALVQSSSMAQFSTVKLADEATAGYSPVEPSVAINYRNPKNIVAGISPDRALVSEDGGQNWKEVKLRSPFAVKGDPALVSDSRGNFYFFHLSDPSGKGRQNDAWLDRIVCQRSTDGGKSWNGGVSIGLNPPKDQDKPWPAVHPTKDDVFVAWTQFDKYGSDDPGCQSNILFAKADNEGKKFSKPKVINRDPGDCLDKDDTAEGAVPAVGTDGRIYLAWSKGGVIFFDRSYDGGETWLRNDLPIAEQAGGWDMHIPGLSRCNGLPVLTIDNSKTSHRNKLYLVWADQKNGESDTDVWFMSSSNGGEQWTEPKRVNGDRGGKHQFLPWIAVDNSTGNIYVVYYDRRAYDDLQTDVYLAFSTDGGLNFKEVKISESPFVPTETKFFGDYTNIAAHKGLITPIWTRMDEGKTSVWMALIKEEELIKDKK
jgi:hypothetical protein